MKKSELEEADRLVENKLKKMREAKTIHEMKKAWGTPLGPASEEKREPLYGADFHQFYTERMPEILADYEHYPSLHVLERRNVHPKVRALMVVAVMLYANHWKGCLHWSIRAKEAGATEEEILEAVAAAVHVKAKGFLVDSDPHMAEIFNHPAFKNAKDQTK